MNDLLLKSEEAIKNLDPDRIYVENVRAILKTNTRFARWICYVAVKMGYFEKKVSIECKNSSCERVIGSYDSIEAIPEIIICESCEDDNLENFKWNPGSIKPVVFYSFIKK